MVLFQRLVFAGMAAGSVIDVNTLFSYEMCLYPTSLFDEKLLLREPTAKSQLASIIISKKPECVVHHDLPSDVVYVIDGGSLLWQVVWKEDETFGNLCERYVNFIVKKYKSAIIVFDSYNMQQGSTKDEAHIHRMGKKVSVDIQVNDDTMIEVQKKPFLDNSNNKQQFINTLSNHMAEADIDVIHSQCDADYDLALTAYRQAEHHPTIVIADDTYTFCLLLHMNKENTHKQVFMQMDQSHKTVSISTLKEHLNKEFLETLPALHALSGCDSTSRPFGIGTSTVVDKYKKMILPCKALMSTSSTAEEVIQAGEQALAIIYGFDGIDLNTARSSKFCNKIATAKQYLKPQLLPPTADAAQLHTMRVYHQVQTWKGENLDPLNWGWVKKLNNRGHVILKPLRMTNPPAPEALLNIINVRVKEIVISVNAAVLSTICIAQLHVKTAKALLAKIMG